MNPRRNDIKVSVSHFDFDYYYFVMDLDGLGVAYHISRKAGREKSSETYEQYIHKLLVRDCIGLEIMMLDENADHGNGD